MAKAKEPLAKTIETLGMSVMALGVLSVGVEAMAATGYLGGCLLMLVNIELDHRSAARLNTNMRKLLEILERAEQDKGVRAHKELVDICMRAKNVVLSYQESVHREMSYTERKEVRVKLTELKEILRSVGVQA